MKKCSFIIINTFLLLVSFAIRPMEMAETTNAENLEFVSSHSCNMLKKIFGNIETIFNEADEITTAQSIAASPFFGEQFVKNVTKLTQEHELELDLMAGRGAKAHADNLKDKGVNVTSKNGLHAKYVAIKLQAPELDNKATPVTAFGYIGSDNLSNTSLHNDEAGILFYSPELFNSLKLIQDKFATQKTPEKKDKQIATVTPLKPTLMSSFEHVLTESKANRFTKLIESDDATDILLISSMTLDSESFIEQLEKTVKERKAPLTVKCYFNRDALNHPELLKKLINLPIQVYIRIEEPAWKDAVIKKIQHSKIFLRKVNGSYLAIISTGNLTDQSDKERNVDVIIPHHEKICTEIQEFLAGVEQKSELMTTETLSKNVQELKEKKEKAKQKRKEKKEKQEKPTKKARRTLF